MSRALRIDESGYYYHVLNRANAKARIFNSEKDYFAFENILEEAHDIFDINLFAYCIMPTHWHLVLSTKEDGDLQKYIKWLTVTHTARWHKMNDTIGQGHIYQGRYKSFICQDDYHLPTLIRYVEKNPKKAKLVDRAEDWRWSSLWRRFNNSKKNILSSWPLPEPKNYLSWINDLSNGTENMDIVTNIDISIKRNVPYGELDWRNRMIRRFGLESTIRKRGGQPKGSDPFRLS